MQISEYAEKFLHKDIFENSEKFLLFHEYNYMQGCLQNFLSYAIDKSHLKGEKSLIVCHSILNSYIVVNIDVSTEIDEKKENCY